MTESKQATPESTHKNSEAAQPYQPIAHEEVHQRFLDLLRRDRDTGLVVAWKQALLEPPNPLKPAQRPALKLPILYALWIMGLGFGGFLWFSLLH
jgi:hypothetical protein